MYYSAETVYVVLSALLFDDTIVLLWQLVHGKTMEEWLRFSVCFWHTFRGSGMLNVYLVYIWKY